MPSGGCGSAISWRGGGTQRFNRVITATVLFPLRENDSDTDLFPQTGFFR
jgi:hypothetical protein